MKSRFILLLSLPLLAFGAQNRGRDFADATNAPPTVSRQGLNRASCPLNAANAATPTTLSAADLSFAIEEERVAHDIYMAASAKWNLGVFANIAGAETRHAAALTHLASTAGIAPPSAQTGVYVSADLQHMHDQLVAMVNESQTGALRAGALIEETDIADLRRMAARVSDDPTRAVLGNLERASGHHLAAFVRNLAALGVTYQPQVLAADDFARLINSGPGRGGSGSGRHFGAGRRGRCGD